MIDIILKDAASLQIPFVSLLIRLVALQELVLEFLVWLFHRGPLLNG